MNYREQLNDPRWRRLRNKRLEYDDYRCVQCGERSKLNVHHVMYESGKKAWEYHPKDLLTLCNPCHEKYHINDKIELPERQKEHKRAKTMQSEHKTDYKSRAYLNDVFSMMPEDVKASLLRMGSHNKKKERMNQRGRSLRRYTNSDEW